MKMIRFRGDAEVYKKAEGKEIAKIEGKETGIVLRFKDGSSLHVDVGYAGHNEFALTAQFNKRREQMPEWAKELRAALKPLYKDKGELYYNRRKDYIGVKLHTRFSFVMRKQNPYDYAEVERIVREVCAKHNKFVTKVQPYLFHVWNNIPAHLRKPVLEV